MAAEDERQQRLIDTRTLTKPGNFRGEPGEWSDWAFATRAYLGALSHRMMEVVERTQYSETVVNHDALEDAEDG